MKKIKILFFLVLVFCLNTQSNCNLIPKNQATKIHSWVTFATIIEQLWPTKYKLWPELKLKIKSINNSNLEIYAPAFINNILASAIYENQDFYSALLNTFIKLKTIYPKISLTQIKDRKTLSILGEKACEILANSIINKLLTKKRVLGRFLKVLSFAGISATGNYIRGKVDQTDTIINILIEKAATEISAELLQRFIIYEN